ncbi:Uncharacterized protein dnm_057940 [Desulfonema magnum]|uniref:Uncharacterized protein n=1 Tax=Desulfonema magnum TaxID=45655 RepID=A0A975BQB9_9BACT|nr:Uncharacterized protein dnm_057940 [Desulfonema magnum]
MTLDDQAFFCHSCFRRNDKLFVRIGSKNLNIEYKQWDS